MQIISHLVYNLKGEYVYMYVCVSLRFSSSDFHMMMPAKACPSILWLLDMTSLLVDKCQCLKDTGNGTE